MGEGEAPSLGEIRRGLQGMGMVTLTSGKNTVVLGRTVQAGWHMGVKHVVCLGA